MKNIEKQFLESLNDEIVINDDDSDRIKETKARVIAAHEAMHAQLRQGMSFAKVLAEEVALHNENVETHAQVRAEYNKLLASSNPEDAEAYRIKVNGVLGKMGIEEIKAKGQKTSNQEDK